MTNGATVSVSTDGYAVSLTATVAADGSIDCKLACNNQSADVKFTGTDVVTDVHA